MPKVSKILLSAVLGVSSLALLILIGVIVWGFIEFSPSQFHGTVISPPKPAIDFALHSDAGLVHLSDLKGKVVMLYFGYTFCPDHCPLTLSKIKIAVSDLPKKETDQVRFVMVTVDPERDNVKKNYQLCAKCPF
jgi:protein SCO1/2